MSGSKCKGYWLCKQDGLVVLLCLHCWPLIEGSSSARETLACGMSSCGIVWHRHLIAWHRHRVASHRLASSASGVASSSHRIASPTCAGASHRFAWMRKTHVIASHRIARPLIRSQSYRLVAFSIPEYRICILKLRFIKNLYMRSLISRIPNRCQTYNFLQAIMFHQKP